MKTFTEEQIYEVVADTFNNNINDISKQFLNIYQKLNDEPTNDNESMFCTPYFAAISVSVDISAKIVKEVLIKLLCE